MYARINKWILEQEPLKAKDLDIEKGESHQAQEKSETNEEEAEVSNDYSFKRLVNFHNLIF